VGSQAVAGADEHGADATLGISDPLWRYLSRQMYVLGLLVYRLLCRAALISMSRCAAFGVRVTCDSKRQLRRLVIENCRLMVKKPDLD